MRKRAVLVAVIAIIVYEIYLLSSTDWESDAALDINPLYMLGRLLLRWGRTLPGIRLMYGGEKGFPLKDLTIWDSIFGCLFYGLAFFFLMWLMTPLPDISVHTFILVNFESRALEEEDENGFQEALMEIPRRHPAAGEGPAFFLPRPDIR
ncbi:hypothetical protein JTE90_008202 [Oedothorax gibbosus]|uniref:Uncharacterized protein n=1 Tax=Oedothorax gibbosus TaxID=931172 RepID=A0AAV6VH40_9ARAC|nr:hypothetical protein JTE90_008202 [Oedothorax gibbosus]